MSLCPKPLAFRGRRQGRQPLNPARGPLAVALPYGSSLLSVGERGRAPCRRPPRVAKNSRVLQFCARRIFSHFSDLVAQDGSTWANIGRKMGQHSLKMGQTYPPRWTNIAPRWANIAPRWANIAPSWANIAPRWANIAPRWANIARRRPSKYPAFYSVFLLFPFFGSFGSTRVNMGQHRPQDRPT